MNNHISQQALSYQSCSCIFKLAKNQSLFYSPTFFNCHLSNSLEITRIPKLEMRNQLGGIEDRRRYRSSVKITHTSVSQYLHFMKSNKRVLEQSPSSQFARPRCGQKDSFKMDLNTECDPDSSGSGQHQDTVSVTMIIKLEVPQKIQIFFTS